MRQLSFRFNFKQGILLAGPNRTGVAAADTSYRKEQETHRPGGLYRRVTLTCNRMFSAITSESVSEAVIISRKPVNR